jgi:hypothetical protein
MVVVFSYFGFSSLAILVVDKSAKTLKAVNGSSGGDSIRSAFLHLILVAQGPMLAI